MDLDLPYKFYLNKALSALNNKNNLETYPVHTSVLYISTNDSIEKFKLKKFEII